MAIKERMSGNEAVSYAIRQVNPDVMPAFPITPSTEIPQMVSTYIANGEMDTEFIPVESEHSSMSAPAQTERQEYGAHAGTEEVGRYGDDDDQAEAAVVEHILRTVFQIGEQCFQVDWHPGFRGPRDVDEAFGERGDQ